MVPVASGGMLLIDFGSGQDALVDPKGLTQITPECRFSKALVQPAPVEAGRSEAAGQIICGCKTTGNMRVLALTACLFVIITVAQLFAAVLAHSGALMADSVSMGVDSATYLLNIVAEASRGKRCHRPFELMVAAVSQAVLIVLTVGVLLESLPNLNGAAEDDDDADEVNPAIVMAFAIWGLLFDALSLGAFVRNQRGSGEQIGVNMTAALSHVGADFARSITTLVESILIMAFRFDGTKTDAWACMAVGSTILLGAALAIFQWVREVIVYARTGQ